MTQVPKPSPGRIRSLRRPLSMALRRYVRRKLAPYLIAKALVLAIGTSLAMPFPEVPAIAIALVAGLVARNVVASCGRDIDDLLKSLTALAARLCFDNSKSR